MLIGILLKLLLNVKSIFSWLYKEIGIKGFIIIGLLCFVIFQNFDIKSKESTISKISKENISLQSLNQTYQKDINLQNASIDLAHKQVLILQKKLDDANKNNTEITTQYSTIIKNILDQPNNLTCNQSIDLVRKNAQDIAKRWNE